MSGNDNVKVMVHHDDSVDISQVFVSPKGPGSKSVLCHFVHSWPSDDSSAPSGLREAAGAHDGLQTRVMVDLFVAEKGTFIFISVYTRSHRKLENIPARTSKKPPGCDLHRACDTKPITSSMASAQSPQQQALPSAPTLLLTGSQSSTLPASRHIPVIPNPTLKELRDMARKRKERNLNLTFWQMMEYSSVPASDEEDSDEGTDGIVKVEEHPVRCLQNPPSTLDLSESDAEPSDARTTIEIQELHDSLAFIEALKAASLDKDGLPADVLHRLCHPICEPLDISDPDLRLSLDLFLGLDQSSEHMYAKMRDTNIRQNPDNEPLTYEQMKRKMVELTGVALVSNDMCINTCMAFTGPYSTLNHCLKCGVSRYDEDQLTVGKKIPNCEFMTIPLGPQLQKTDEILELLEMHDGQLPELDDFFSGEDYLDAVRDSKITPGDVCLMFSMDGAQLYQSKQSDCWIYIWVIMDLSPDKCYKKRYVLPGGFIPGPNNPQHVDSFMFSGLHHLAGLQKEGLQIWNRLTKTVFECHPFMALGTADGVGLNHLNGMCRHNGKQGCRTYCGTTSRHKDGAPNYYPAHLKPDNYMVSGCDHPDVNLSELPIRPDPKTYFDNLKYILASRNITQFRTWHRETGIIKPSLFSGLPPEHMLKIPDCFPIDLMHLASLNLTEHLVNIWHGTLPCDKDDDKDTWDFAVLQGDVWKEHGTAVAKALPYLPGSFDCPPRNPTEKLNSGYKAWEFLIWIYRLGPALLYNILPAPYWDNFCRLAQAMCFLHQHRITAIQVQSAHKFILEFIEGFEQLYYQRKLERIHFCRQSIHTSVHLAPQTTRTGPKPLHGQWVLERTIGNLGKEICLHSSPFANLAQRGLLRSQVNVLKAMAPDLDPDDYRLPRGAKDLKDGFILLRARDKYAHRPPQSEGKVIKDFLLDHDVELAVNWVP
ncbi:hypothetical protein EWM64_g5571 [Hericium alpestre]|uniref:Uncharacterized protein n=1 Tax=Hericium alpestre TaxID=135208 RepID=A0A4Y9ZWZ7_9AGAM|nr:hypothetical protein EWM64_g5571 [Hericium alpestre]